MAKAKRAKQKQTRNGGARSGRGGSRPTREQRRRVVARPRTKGPAKRRPATRIPVVFAKTKAGRVRFKIGAKWSPSYASRQSARRAATRTFGQPVISATVTG